MDELLEQQGKIIDQICDDMMESPMQGKHKLSVRQYGIIGWQF